MAELNGDEGDNFLKSGVFGSDDILRGFGGNDVLNGFFGTDTLDGGSGIDTAVFEAADFGWTVNLQSGLATENLDNPDRTTLISIENVSGSGVAISSWATAKPMCSTAAMATTR